ncbi:prealbumin-like fold domain-containing protein [Humibacter ginsenosidimutans]|uniref:VWA domain-containing protein n=1 Tax=Humibacter ginsenosidimutans TaxID=2599293 RepID=A0A5B8M4Z9_9MICO|nr:VWA domain-containing protein [Humibacter ginsenosidimutans]
MATQGNNTYDFNSGDSHNVPQSNTYTLTATATAAIQLNYATTFTCRTSGGGGTSFTTTAPFTVTFGSSTGRSAACTFTQTYKAPASIVIHASGTRTAGTNAGNAPDGTKFQAVATTGNPGTFTCTTTAGTCTISVPAGYKWNVSEVSTPSGWFPLTTMSYGTSSTVNSTTYQFQTTTLNSGGTQNVPGPTSGTWSANGTYADALHSGNDFSGTMAVGLDDNSIPQKCGLNIALVLDQSGSMADNSKEANLIAAAKQVVSGLQNTPSTMSVYPFADTANTPLLNKSLGNAADVASLNSFIGGLSPNGSTNWDDGLYNVAKSSTTYDLVLFLTDGAPTTYSPNDSGNGQSSYFQYVEQAVASANAIKAKGSALIGIGIGLSTTAGGSANLADVTGLSAGDPSNPTSSANYYASTSSGFGALLTTLATQGCTGQVNIQKQVLDTSGNVIDNSADTNNWTYNVTTSTTGATVQSPVTTAQSSGKNGYASSNITFPSSGSASVTVSENTSSGPAGYAFNNAVCTLTPIGGGTPTTVKNTAGQASVTFTATTTSTVSCVFQNKQIPTYTVTVNKTWENWNSGDSAAFTVNGKALPNSPVSAGSGTQSLGTSAGYASGTAMTVNEALTAPGAAYTQSLKCTYSQNGSTVTVSPLQNPSTGVWTFSMPAANVTCAADNNNATHTVTLQKQWINGVPGDKTNLTVNGDASTKNTSTVGSTPSFTDTTNVVKELNVPVGSSVAITEALQSSNGGTYSANWSCTSGTPTSGTGFSGSFTMPNQDVTCTIANTNGTATVNLYKNWSGAIGGDVSTISINGPGSLDDSHNSTVPAAGGTYNDTTPATVSVPIGSDVTVSETMANNDGAYTTTLVCAGAPVTTTDSNGTKSYTFQVKANTNCTFTNSNGSAPITLSKLWDTSIANDTAGLTISGSGVTGATGAIAVADGTLGQVSSQKATANATLGSTVTIAEVVPAAGHTNVGTYQTVGYTCEDQSGKSITVSVVNGSYQITVPKTATSVSCQVENKLSTASVTLKKTWINGIGGDSATVYLDGTPYSGLSTVGGTVGSVVATQTDVLANKVQVALGTTIGAHETLGTNRGGYNEAVSCVDSNNDPVTVVVAGGVTCTVTNTAKQSTVTLQKKWQGGVKIGSTGDSETLQIAPQAGFGTAASTTATVGTNGQVDSTPSASVSTKVIGGGTVALSETPGLTNYAQYNGTLTCSNNVTVKDGAFTAPTDGSDVTCTYVNTPKASTVTLTKNWQGGVNGDTAALQIIVNGATPGTNTSTYNGTNGIDAGHAAVAQIPQGTVVTLAEVLGGKGTNGSPLGSYAATIDCGSGSVALGSGGYNATVPQGGLSCTITNTQNTHTVTLKKDWTGSIAGDSTNLSINNGTAVKATTTGGDFTSTQQATASVGVGSTVNLAESTAGPSGSYTSSLTCDNATPTGGSFTMPDKDVTCTFHNANKTVNVVLQKAWENSHAGDTTVLHLTETAPGSASDDSSTVTAPETSETATIDNVPVGASLKGSETLGADNAASYTQTLTCDNGVTVAADGSFNIPKTVTAGSTVTCTLENSATKATVWLYKSWVNGVANDTANLLITGGEYFTPWMSTAVGGNQVDSGNSGASAGTYTGSTVHLKEGVTHGAVGYTSTLECKNGDNVVSLGSTDDQGTSLTIPKDATTVICRYTNTAQSGTITLHKTVNNTHGGSALKTAWTLTAAGPSNTSVTGKDGDASVTDVVSPVGTYTLSENPGNSAAYTLSNLVCTNNGKAMSGVGVDNPSFTLAVGDNVDCTFTNQDQPAHLTLKKDVDETQAGGNVTAKDFTLTATPIKITGQGTVSGNGDPTTAGGVNNVAIFAGQYTLSESGPAGFVAGTWTCTGGSVGATDPTTHTATLTVANGQSASCEITNTAIQPKLTLVKDVASSGDFTGAGQPSDWTLTADGPTKVTGAGGSDSIVNQGVKVGTYDLSELADGTYRTQGYTLTDLTCVDNNTKQTIDGIDVDNPSVDLTEGDNVTCTFTNTPTPAKWTIAKTSDKGLSVMPGDTIGYTVTITHDPTTSWPALPLFASAENIDPLTGLGDATYNGDVAVTNGGSVSLNSAGADQGVFFNLNSYTGVDFSQSFVVTYSYTVNKDAWGVSLYNALTPPPNFTCVGDNNCSTTSDTPDLVLWKTSEVTAGNDPNNNDQVLPGGQITYTLHAYNYTDADLPAGQTETDDLSGVLDHATLDTPLPDGLAFDGDHTLTWTLPAIDADGTAEVSFTVTVDSTDPGPDGADLVNTMEPGTVGYCLGEVEAEVYSPGDVQNDFPEDGSSCTTTTHEPHLDLGITKSALQDGEHFTGPVDDDAGATSEYEYSLEVANNSDEAVGASTVTDALPSEISLDTTQGTNGFSDIPAGWTPSYDATTNTVTIAIASMGLGETDTITLFVKVNPVTETAPIVQPGEDGPAPVTPPADISNTACVSMPNDIDPTNDCGTATVTQKAVDANVWVQCKADIPYLHYDIQTTDNVSSDPVTLLWTANQPGQGGVPSTDLPPDPASLTKTLHSGDSGSILWPGGAVNPQGIGIGFPGWRPIQESDYVNGVLVLPDPSVPAFAGLVYDPTHVATDAWRYQSTVTVSVNPTATYIVNYPEATAACAVARETQVGFTKTASVTNTTPGGSFTYSMAAHNLNLGAASPVTIKDPIPSDIKVTKIETSTTAFPRWQDCAVTGTDANGYGGTLNCTLFGDISLSAPSTPAVNLSVSVRPTTTATSITNTATLCFKNMDNASETGCEDASATVYLNGGSPLADTGSNIWSLLGWAGGLLVVGTALMGWLWRRRRDEGELE